MSWDAVSKLPQRLKVAITRLSKCRPLVLSVEYKQQEICKLSVQCCSAWSKLGRMKCAGHIYVFLWYRGHILTFKIWLGKSNWHDKGQYEYFLIFRKWWNCILFLLVFVTLARLILFEWDISTMGKGVIHNNHPVQALLIF